MTVRELFAESETVAWRGAREGEVAGLAYDSRRVRPGDVFFALGGQKADGRAFVRAAFDAGAVAAVVAAGSPLEGPALIEVEEPRRTLAECAARWCGHPSRALAVIGVTGTNGKTTITYMLDSILRAAGRATGVIGTTGVRIRDAWRDAAFTTPEAPELQGLLREMVREGVGAVAIEISSHALVQRRAYGLECDAAIFTNLTQDHLDYHGTMESYLDAKLMLFDGRNGATGKATLAVVNADDPSAPRVLAAAGRGGLRAIRYGRDPACELAIARVEPHADGLRLAMRWSGGGAPFACEVALPMLGRFNAANAAAALAATLALGVEPEAARRGLESLAGVPGRLERVEAGQAFRVVVDYAHTPDALERALAAVREHAAGRVLLVFGCGGDRDRGKRPRMGGIAARGADAAWVTNDNPRTEDPRAIAADIVAGAPHGVLRVELGRRAAIGAALAEARPGDVVLIAGKGHETSQAIGGQVLPFDDRAVARQWLEGART